jgi:hypothetical protein
VDQKDSRSEATLFSHFSLRCDGPSAGGLALWGRFFAYFSWRDKKSERLPGRPGASSDRRKIRIKLERRTAFRADCPKPNNQKNPSQDNKTKTKQKRRPTQGRTAFKKDKDKQIS